MKNENICLLKLLHRINDATSHGAHNIIMYNFVYHNFQFLFHAQDITLFLGIYD